LHLCQAYAALTAYDTTRAVVAPYAREMDYIHYNPAKQGMFEQKGVAEFFFPSLF